MKIKSGVVVLVGCGLVVWGWLSSPNAETQGVDVSSSYRCTVKAGSIYDGDTLRVFCEGEELKLRLCGIDAPEKEQKGGIEARDYLRSRLPDHAAVRVHPIEKDRYGRTVAEIFSGETFINAELVAKGHAWYYQRYSGNCPNRGAIAMAAQSTHPTGTPPWEFRKQQRSN